MTPRTILFAAAALTLSACGQGIENAAGNNAAAPQDATANPPANAAEVPPAETANMANAAAPAAPRAEPAPKPAPRAEPRPPASQVQPKETEPDPHAGHDMDDMSH